MLGLFFFPQSPSSRERRCEAPAQSERSDSRGAAFFRWWQVVADAVSIAALAQHQPAGAGSPFAD